MTERRRPLPPEGSGPSSEDLPILAESMGKPSLGDRLLPTNGPLRSPRPVVVLAVLFIGVITGGAVFGLTYGVVFYDDDPGLLGTLAATGLGGLLAVIGATKQGPSE